MYKNHFLMFFILFLIPVSLKADMGTYFDSYLKDLERNKIRVFYTSCVTEDHIANLLVALGSYNALLVERKNGVVVNLAKITFKQGNPVITETHGGIYSYHRVKDLVNSMLNSNFQFLDASLLKNALDISSRPSCEHLGSESGKPGKGLD